MERFTMDFIYALKRRHSDKSIEDAAIDFMAEQTMTPREYYSYDVMYGIALEKMLDYLATADNPTFEIRRFFEIKNRIGCPNELYAILAMLELTQVLSSAGEDGVCINGFS